MKIDVGLQLKMGQQLIMTPQLQQAIKLLQLSRHELEQLIEQSLIENPVLEAELESSESGEEKIDELTPEDTYESADETLLKDENETNYDEEWQEYVERMSAGSGSHDKPSRNNEDSENNSLESLSTYRESLVEHLLWQLEMSNFIPQEFQVAEYIIGNIDNDGYLGLSLRHLLASDEETYNLCKEILDQNLIPMEETDFLSNLYETSHTESKKEIDAYESKANKKIPAFMIEEAKKRKNERPLWTPIEEIPSKVCAVAERILKRIQTFDPPGVGARNLQECLRIHAHQAGLSNKLEGKIICECMKLLTQKDLKKIARKMRTSLEEVIGAYHTIASFEPKPGRPFGTDQIRYIIPDVYVYKANGEYKIKINEQGLPKIRINSEYMKLVEEHAKNKAGIKKQVNNDKDEKNMTFLYINEKIKAGEWLMKSIDQRQRTIYRVAESILKNQEEFFEKGVDSLKPMVLKDVAEDIEVHESTVSRVTTNKFMHTPQGIFELKYFFTSGIKQEDGDVISSKKIKDLIQKLIKEENSTKPYTDEYLSIILERDLKIKVARRTVAKYRESLNIMSSNKRKNFFR